MDSTLCICNGSAESFHGISGEEDHRAPLLGGTEGICMGTEQTQHILLAALGSGAHVDHVGIREVGGILAGDGNNGDSYAHLLQMAAQYGEIGPLAVEAHDLGIEMKDLQFHLLTPPFL